MNATATLYDVLGLPPTASEGDIHAAHMRLVRHYQNGIHGLSGAEADQRIQAIKGAWWTLSDPGRRLAYDIQKKSEGIYAVLNVTAEPAVVKELDRQYTLNEQIMRTKVIRPDLHK